MPTVKPRHQVTETPQLAAALEVAARRWPGRSRSALLARLAEEGARALESEERAASEDRRALVERYAGGFEFPDDHIEQLREDWPA